MQGHRQADAEQLLGQIQKSKPTDYLTPHTNNLGCLYHCLTTSTGLTNMPSNSQTKTKTNKTLWERIFGRGRTTGIYDTLNTPYCS